MTIAQAFKSALRELDSTDTKPHLRTPVLNALKTALAVQAEGDHRLRPATWAKLRYRSRKLGRAWARYTKSGQESAPALENLREEWAMLVNTVSRAKAEEPAVLLQDMVDGMEFGDRQNDTAKRNYLLTRSRTLGEIGQIRGINWPSPAAYFLDGVLELIGDDVDGRRRLIAFVTQTIQDRDEPGPVSLTGVVAAWLNEWDAGRAWMLVAA